VGGVGRPVLKTDSQNESEVEETRRHTSSRLKEGKARIHPSKPPDSNCVRPGSLAPIIIGVWMVAGIALLIYFATSSSARITDTGRVFLEESDSA